MALDPVAELDAHAVTWANVQAFAPALPRLTEEAQQQILFYVNQWSSENALGSAPTLHMARVLLAAHFALSTSRATTGAAGPVTSEAMGGLRRSYGLIALSAATANLGSTIYGQQVMLILSMSDAHGPILVR